jgi:shikimate 5-dehydrogenase
MNAVARTRFDILVNATSAGMTPRVGETPFAGRLPARVLKGTTVFDAVYNPPVTRLLGQAAAAGARTIPGMEMYLRQAALQALLYAGRLPRRATMQRLLGGKRRG